MVKKRRKLEPAEGIAPAEETPKPPVKKKLKKKKRTALVVAEGAEAPSTVEPIKKKKKLRKKAAPPPAEAEAKAKDGVCPICDGLLMPKGVTVKCRSCGKPIPNE